MMRATLLSRLAATSCSYGAPLILLLFAGPAFGAAPREMGLLPEPQGSLMGWDGGDILTLPPAGELTVQKVRPADCRVVLGFSHAPIDGRVDSLYHGIVNEYNNSQNYRVNAWVLNPLYEYVEKPMVRVRLADKNGFNYLLIRGGFNGSIYRDANSPMGPGNGQLLAELTACQTSSNPVGVAHYKFWRLHFPEPVKTEWVGFLRASNLLADVSFYRVGAAAVPRSYTGSMELRIGEAVQDVTTLGLDFIRFSCVDPSTQHLSTFERRFFRPGDRAVYRLKSGGEGQAVNLTGEISGGPLQQVHFLTDPLPAGAAIGGIRFDLGLKDVSPSNCVMLAVQDPLVGGQELMRFDARMGEAERIRVVLDFPAQIVAEGRRFWITLASREGGQILPDSRMTLLTVEPEAARAEYIAQRLLMLRGNFSALSEGRPWNHEGVWSVEWLLQYDGSEWSVQKNRPQLIELYAMLEHLRLLAPDDPIIAGQYDPWLVRGGTSAAPFVQPEIPAIAGVPHWARLMDRAALQIAEIPKWWICNRMTPGGELGGAYSDDTDMVGDWTPSILMDSENFAPLARDCMRRMSAGVLEHTLHAGVNITVTDPLHAYEEGQNLMSQMPLVFYGNPQYVEWLMESIRTCDKWMVRTPEGALKWRVAEFGWSLAENPPAEIATSVSGDADLMLHPYIMLAWYNGNTGVIERITAYTAGMPDPYQPRAYNGGGSVHMAAYWHTGDPTNLHFPKLNASGNAEFADVWAWFKRQPDAAVHAPEARVQPWWPQWAGFYQNNGGVRGDMAWAVQPDRGILVKSLEATLWGLPEGGGAERFLYMRTGAQPFTDRVALPAAPLAQAMLGGYTIRNKFWPAYAVSYEKLGGDFAALVLAQGRDRLKVVMVNLRDTPREGAFRVWQLVHGKYELKVGPDANDDGQMDAVESAQILELARMDAVPVNLPPRKLTMYELHQVEVLDDIYTRADMALSVDDVVKNGNTLKVTVHNIGAKAATNIVVAAADALSNVLAKAAIASIEAPLDLMPKVASVELPAANAAMIVVDPDNTIPEITRLNNSAPVLYIEEEPVADEGTGSLQATGGNGDTHYVAQAGQTPVEPYTNDWPSAASNIQAAVDAATAGDTVLVGDGVYDKGSTNYTGFNRVYISNAIVVRSVNGPAVTTIKGQYHSGEPGDPDAVINGSNAVRCVAISAKDARLIGFTLRDGATTDVGSDAEKAGAGVYGLSVANGGIVSNCVIRGNVAYRAGGGAYLTTLWNCMVISNWGMGYWGGGFYRGVAYNCLIAGNQGALEGGGYICTLENCTVVGNKGGSCGGVNRGTIRNSVVYFNSPNNWYESGGAVTFVNSCTWPEQTTWKVGDGNITNDPLFIANGSGYGVTNIPGNYRLSHGSSCINAGTNMGWMTNACDLDGHRRVLYGRVDMGCYELILKGSVLSFR